MNLITIGEILRPKGIKGAVKIKPLTDDPKRFDLIKSVSVDGAIYKIAALSYEGGHIIASFCEISDRNAAELLRGKLLKIERREAVVPKEGEYFVADLIGCTLVDEKGKKLGEILSVDSYGAADVITCANLKTEFRFPFLKKIVHEIDVGAKRFAVIRKLWENVVIYDD